MSEKANKTVSGVEQSQLSECLFRYLMRIDVGCEWQSEYLSGDTPSICMKQITTAYKLRENIIGGYTAELPFAIYYCGAVTDTRDTLDVTKQLNYLAEVFEKETLEKFPNLSLTKGYEPLKLEMASTPADESGKQNNTAVFMALYKLTYRKKSKIG